MKIHYIYLGVLMGLLQPTWATPDFRWDFATHYPQAERLSSGLSEYQRASIERWDAGFAAVPPNPSGSGLSPEERAEVLSFRAYYRLGGVPGALTGRGIVVREGDKEDTNPDLNSPATFAGDFVRTTSRLTVLYGKCTPAQAEEVAAVYADVVEHFLDQNYLPGGKPDVWLSTGYKWVKIADKVLGLSHTLPPEKRDLLGLSLFYLSEGHELLRNPHEITVDSHYNFLPIAFKGIARISDGPAKWQLLKLIRRNLDLSIAGSETDSHGSIIQLDGSICHHNGHHVSYAAYTFATLVENESRFITAGIGSEFSGAAVDRIRKAALSWAFHTSASTHPLHQRMRAFLPWKRTVDTGDGGDKALDFLIRAAELTALDGGTSIGTDLEMAHAAIAKVGAGNSKLPEPWRGINPATDPVRDSPLYTATLRGHHSHTTNGVSSQRGPGGWMASIRGQQGSSFIDGLYGQKKATGWAGGEVYSNPGSRDYFTRNSMRGSLMIIATGREGREPNEPDSGYWADGWDPFFFPNVTTRIVPLPELCPAKRYETIYGDGILMGSANLRESGMWMYQAPEARKSAFFIGNRIVLITNAIHDANPASPHRMHTGLIQQGHGNPTAEPLILDGTVHTGDGEWSLAAGGNHKIVDGQGNGYFVHPGASTPPIKARRGEQKWIYAENTKGGSAPEFKTTAEFISRQTEIAPTTADFSRVWFDHGEDPRNQSLEYSVLVKPGAGELDTYVAEMTDFANPPVSVSHTEKVHRIRDNASGTQSIAVFDASETIDDRHVSSVGRPGAYIWRPDDHLLRLSMSSADIDDRNPFEITLKGRWEPDPEEKPKGMTTTYPAGTTLISLPYRQGAPQNLVLKNSDADADGMPDHWEVAAGLDAMVDDSALDGDGDGQSNRLEFLTGTDPSNPSSRWQSKLEHDGGRLLLVWPNVPDRTIRIWKSTDLRTWTLWDVPGNNGVPLPGNELRSLPVSREESHGYFRFSVEERK